MTSFISYIAPPALGAFIGYLTNYVAIRMLFKPLKPWHVLGVRVPMTPGVIPAKRHELARNIGEMVGKHLLTSEDVSRAIGEQGFQHDLRLLIEDRVEETLEKDLGTVASIVPERFRSYFEVGVKILRWRFLKHLHNHLDSDVFVKTFTATLTSHLNEFLGKELDGCLSTESREHLYTVLESAMANFLSSPEVLDWIEQYLNQQIKEFFDRGGRLEDLVPDSMLESILDRLEQEVPHLLQKLAKLVEEPVMQDRIVNGITGAIGNFASSLGPMAAVIGSFISPESIGQRVRSYLGDKGSDVSAWLVDETVRQKVAAILREKVREFVSAPVADLLKDVDPDKIKQARDWLCGSVADVLKKPETVHSISGLIRKGIDTQTRRSLNDILSDLFGEDGLTKGKGWVAEEVTAGIRSPKVKRMLDDLVTELIERKLLAEPVGPLSAFLPKEVQAGISDYLLQQVSMLLVREVPGLVDSLNIKEIVTRKVDSLDLVRLEGLLLGIMQEQFKYINLFGALLGFIIGLVNLVFLLNI